MQAIRTLISAGVPLGCREAQVAVDELTLTEVAKMLRLSTKTVAQHARRGELVVDGSGGAGHSRRKHLDAFLKEMPHWLFECQRRG